MNNFRLKILITVFMVAIFVAPFSLNIKINTNGHLEINTKIKKIEAINVNDCFKTSTLKIDQTSVNSNSAKFSGMLQVTETDTDCTKSIESTGYVNAYDKIGHDASSNLEIYFIIKDSGNNEIGKVLFPQIQNLSMKVLGNGFSSVDTKLLNNIQTPYLLLKPESTYTVSLFINGSLNNSEFTVSDRFTTTKANPNDSTTINDGINNSDIKTGEATLSFDCGITNLPGCIAQIFYSLAEVATWLPRVAGGFLDFFIYYATNSSSYSNQFVEQGWAAVRDIANIFFIIALIFIAIKTILNLNVTDNKKLVGTVIIIALIINFSLFTTKVVIDASNILAKIFYNNITSKDDKGATLTGEGGQKTLSVGIANKFNPQGLAMAVYPLGLGYFIFMTLLIIAISVYTAYIFLSVALLFVARVVSLWISMIFSPLAFASYTVPFDIPGFGHKEWWDTLLKTAFMAPLFVFMLYLIILFAGFLSKIVSYADNPELTNSENVMQHLMSILIPFIIIAVLLTKSKKLAVEYSGEMGKAVMKGAQMVGGLALGAATGGAALGLSSTFGAKARATANDDNLKKAASGDKEHFAKLAQTDVRYKDPKYQQKMQAAAQKKLASANKTAARSFDLGQTTIGKGFGKMSGMDLTKGRIAGTKTENLKGGRTAQQERVQEEAQKRTKSYHMTGAAAAEQNDKVARATQYKVDKEKAKETSDTKDNEVWKKEYETKARENKFSANPVDEKTFEENYKKNNPQSTPSFNEKEFKATYEKGDEDSLKNFGIEHEVKAGNVDENAKTVKKINEERTTAYANSLQTKADKDAARGAVKTMFEEFVKGAKKTALKPAVLGLGASGVLTGGAGTILAGATVLGGGFLGAFKGLITSKSKLGFMEGVKKSETAETIAAIRKGEDPNKWMKDAFKKLEKGEHVDNEKLVDTVSKAIKHEEPAPASHSNDTAPKNHDTHEH